MPYDFVGQSLEPSDPRFGRVEISVFRQRGQAATVFATKYRADQIGERSFGMSPAVAREIAALLLKAADRAERQSLQDQPVALAALTAYGRLN